MIQLDHIDVTFQQKKRQIQAVKDVTIHINEGDIYGIVGYSGAGKSTLVRVINLLQVPSAGTITVDGDVIYQDQVTLKPAALREKRRDIGMIFQHFNLMAQMTVAENVAFALKHSKLNKEQKNEKVAKLLELVGLADRAENYPAQLSGGQKQRVAIARALANDPKILISDESTSALDPKTTKQILALLQELNKKLGLTIVLITHEMQIVKDIANRVAVMQNGELIEVGSVLDIFSNPKNALTQDFITVATGIDEAMVKINQQAIVKNLPDDSILAHLKYAGSVTDTAIINDIYKQYQVSANILFGNIEILDHTPVGELVVILSGETQNLETAKAELENAGVYMTVISFTIGGFLGLVTGLLLVLTRPGGVIENRIVFQILDKITSLFRAIPFIILLAFINPLTYLLLKNTIGPTAALVPLSLAVFPFFARQVQVVLSELDGGVIEAAQASGATFWDIVGVYLREGLPDLIRVTTVTIISLIGETAMAGAVGAGGLGTLAINYGKNMFNNDVIFVATLLILILIVLVQFIGDFLSKKISHR